MTATLVLHQLRFDIRAARRNRRRSSSRSRCRCCCSSSSPGSTASGTVEVDRSERRRPTGLRARDHGARDPDVLVHRAADDRGGPAPGRRPQAPPGDAGAPARAHPRRALTSMAISIAAVAVMLVIAGAAYDIRPSAGWPAADAHLGRRRSLCFASCGYAVAGLVTTPESAGPIVQVILLPLQLISGVYFPTDGLPDWLHTVASLFPLSTSPRRSSTRCSRPQHPLGRPRRHGDLVRRRGGRRGAHVPLAAAAVASRRVARGGSPVVDTPARDRGSPVAPRDETPARGAGGGVGMPGQAVRFVDPSGAERIGRLDGETVTDAGPAEPRGLRADDGGLAASSTRPTARRTPSTSCGCCAPVMPRKLICIGLNYRDHAAESDLRDPRGAGDLRQVADGDHRPRRRRS